MKQFLRMSYCLVIAIFIVSSAFAQEMNPEAGKLYNEGNKYLKSGNYKGAISTYEKALAIQKDYRTYYQMGIALKKSGKYKEAEEALQNSIKLNKDFEAGYNAIGGVQFAMGNYKVAAESFETVLKISKNNRIKEKVKSNLALAYAKLGNDAMARGDLSEAVNYLKKAVDNYNYDAAYLSLAKAYSDLGQFEDVIKAAEKALKYRSKISKGGPYYYLGLAYKNLGQTDKAKEMFRNARADRTYKKLVEYELSSLR